MIPKNDVLKDNCKMYDSTDLNKTHINFTEHIQVCIQKYLFNLGEPLYRRIFSILNIQNRYFIYNTIMFLIKTDAE
jgi:hypothetical protein